MNPTTHHEDAMTTKPSAQEIAKKIRDDGMQCRCDLDRWEPEVSTGHSHVCPIHKAAMTELAKRQDAIRSSEAAAKAADAAAIKARFPKIKRPGFVHRFAGLKDEAFFQHIDDTGGWPVGYKFVGFAHSSEREAGFTMDPEHHGWWTTTHSADDYYMWKLSPEAQQRFANAVVGAVCLPKVDASRLYVQAGMCARTLGLVKP